MTSAPGYVFLVFLNYVGTTKSNLICFILGWVRWRLPRLGNLKSVLLSNISCSCKRGWGSPVGRFFNKYYNIIYFAIPNFDLEIIHYVLSFYSKCFDAHRIPRWLCRLYLQAVHISVLCWDHWVCLYFQKHRSNRNGKKDLTVSLLYSATIIAVPLILIISFF